jgi:hypothetical protein
VDYGDCVDYGHYVNSVDPGDRGKRSGFLYGNQRDPVSFTETKGIRITLRNPK